MVVSGRATTTSPERFEHLGVNKISGYTWSTRTTGCGTSRRCSPTSRAPSGWPENIRAYFDLAEEFQPDVVISDFESWTYLYGKNHRLPILSIDNMQIIDRCTHAPEIVDG